MKKLLSLFILTALAVSNTCTFAQEITELDTASQEEAIVVLKEAN